MNAYIYKSREKKCKGKLYFFILINFILLFFFVIPSFGATVQLSWDKVSGDEISCYNIYYGLQHTDFTSEADILIKNIITNTNCSVSNLQKEKTFESSDKSINSYDMDSDFYNLLFYNCTKDSKNKV